MNMKTLLVIAFLVLVRYSEAATYVVGDSLGWTIPTNGASAYSTWASQHVFNVGDVLVFNFTTGIHDVAKVNKQAFDSCTSTNTPITLVTAGPASFTLNTTGPDYYICAVGQHCSLGQKLAINVSPASTGAPAPSISSPPTQTPSLAPTPTPSTVEPLSPGPAPSGMTEPPSGLTPASEAAAPSPPSDSASSVPNPPPPPSSDQTVIVGYPVIVFVCVVLGLIVV